MSEDWRVYCKTCNEEHHFDDANHREDLMWLLIDHAETISKLAPLIRDDRNWYISFKCCYGDIDPEWFLKHLGHDLIPRSEYGKFSVRGE